MSDLDADNPNQVKSSELIDLKSLIQQSKNFQRLKKEVLVATRLSLTGITNLVVNYEDPYVVDTFLNDCFKSQDLYNNTINIDAIELQRGAPGAGMGSHWIDELIYGSYEMESNPANADVPEPKIDPQTGKRKRLPNGFVSRKAVQTPGSFKDKLLIIKNIDYCLDFCQAPGIVDSRALWIFDNFRNVNVRKTCRLLLITNKPLVFPFKVLTVTIPAVDRDEANHVINSFVSTYKNKSYTVTFTSNQREQMIRKLSGLTYTQAGDSLGSVMQWSESSPGSKVISGAIVLKKLRAKINQNFMEDGFGLTHLSPRPWEDYICPESSNFTYDVKKIMRDFKEIERLKKEMEKAVLLGKSDDSFNDIIEAIQIRMPHIFVLYGKGGVGKSAFPIHLAGLLEYDVWDFNINAVHSKWIGEGSKQMRETLKRITSTTHLIVRVDEYDRAMGATSESGQGMHEAHKQVEAEFMNWLQNCQEENVFVKNNIIVVLTTNHKENITGPLLRSGRADLVIDIDNFDAKSMKETFMTASRRMKNRGVRVLSFYTQDELQKAIEKLDLDKMAELCTVKGFTVRDIETLIMEMAAHNYYYNLTGKGLKWNTETFLEVLEYSQGSVRDSSTGELVLGDRHILMQQESKEKDSKDKSSQSELNFVRDPLKGKALEGMKEL
jgi:hypothetical protein